MSTDRLLRKILVLGLSLMLLASCASSKKSSLEKRIRKQEVRKSNGDCPGNDCN
jgi:hypothetical protein